VYSVDDVEIGGPSDVEADVCEKEPNQTLEARNALSENEEILKVLAFALASALLIICFHNKSRV